MSSEKLRLKRSMILELVLPSAGRLVAGLLGVRQVNIENVLGKEGLEGLENIRAIGRPARIRDRSVDMVGRGIGCSRSAAFVEFPVTGQARFITRQMGIHRLL